MTFLRKTGEKNTEEQLTEKAPHFHTKLSHKFLIKADALRVNNMFKESIKHYLSALMLERENVDIYIGLAQSYMFLKEFDKAVEVLEKAEKTEPENARLPFELGCCFMQMGLPCVAAVKFKEAIVLDKDNLDAQLQLGIAHEIMDEPEMALKVYQCIIEKHPSYFKAYQHKASLLVELSQYKEASQIFAELIKINPQYYKAILGIGLCFDKLGRTDGAVRYYKKFLRLKPDSKNAPDVVNRLEKIKKEKLFENKNFLRLA